MHEVNASLEAQCCEKYFLLFYNNMTSIEEANPEALVKSEYGSLIEAIHHLPFLYIYLSLKRYSPHFCREHLSTGE